MAAALGILSVGLSIYGSMQAGDAADDAAQYNARQAQQNAKYARVDAITQATQSMRETYLRMGTLRANASKNGGQFGSALDIIGDAAAQGELQRQNIIETGRRKAEGFNNTATLDQMQGDAAIDTSYYKAAGSLLTGAANTYSNSLLTRK